jgi:hypothetical protein
LYWQVAVFGALVSEEQGAIHDTDILEMTDFLTMIEED